MRIFVSLGAVLAMLGVAFGAFGAHGLKTRVTPELLVTWNTGVLYHLVHALALVLVGILCQLLPEVPMVRFAGWFLLAGITLFSFSLYLLVLTDIRALGMITPLGGISFLVGWVLLAAAAWQHAS